MLQMKRRYVSPENVEGHLSPVHMKSRTRMVSTFRVVPYQLQEKKNKNPGSVGGSASVFFGDSGKNVFRDRKISISTLI